MAPSLTNVRRDAAERPRLGMSFDVSPDNLYREAEGAIAFRKRHTDLSQELIRAMAANRYRSDWQTDEDRHENHAFEWIVNMVPNLVYTNPAVDLKSTTLPDDDRAVLAARAGMNSWIKAVDLAGILTEIATDLQFDFGVGLISLAPTPGPSSSAALYSDNEAGEPPSLRPMLHRLSPRRFFCDPQCTGPRQARYMGHIWIDDLERLLAAKLPDGTPKYDREAIEAMAVDERVDDLLKETGQTVGGDRVTRRQLVGYEMFIPETGMIYTIAASGPTHSGNARVVKYLRKPRRYRGPQTGPYVLFGLYGVPDQIYPLPPLAVVHDLMEEINAHAGQASEDAGAAKQLIVTDGDPKLVNTITSAANGTVIAIPQFSGRAQAFQIGGPQKTNLDYIALLRDRLDRITGLTDSVRGSITGATAEEIHTTQANRNLRIRFAQSRFRSSVIECLRVVLYHLWNNPNVRFPVRSVDETTGDAMVGEFQGGPDPTSQQEQPSVDSLSIEIEPYTMEAVDQAVLQARMQRAGDLIFNVSQVMVAQPWMRWRKIIDDQFETLNIKGGGARYIDFDMLSRAQQLANPVLFGLVDPMAAGTQAPEEPRPKRSTPGSQASTDARASQAARQPAHSTKK